MSLKPWAGIPETTDGEIKPVALTSQQSGAPYLLEEMHETRCGSLGVQVSNAFWMTDTILGAGVARIYKTSSQPLYRQKPTGKVFV